MKKHIRIVSRFDLETGIGWHGWSFAQTLSLSPDLDVEAVVTASGIDSAVRQRLEKLGVKVTALNKVKDKADFSVYCDVLGQEADTRVLQLGQINAAYVVFDSSRIPDQWGDICNTVLDVVLTPSQFVKDVLVSSGVTKDVLVLPMVVKSLTAQKPVAHAKPTFGFAGSYEIRKNVDMLVEAFSETFDESEADLKIHIAYSHLPMEQLTQLKLKCAQKNITFSEGKLAQGDYEVFLNSLDCFVSLSGGEGYSLIPREFMHLGRPLLLSHAGAHQNIPPMDGLLFVESNIPYPARYPQIDGLYHGYFELPYKKDVQMALRHMHSVLSQPASSYPALQDYAASYTPEKLRDLYVAVVAPRQLVSSPFSDVEANGVLCFKNQDLIEKYKKLGGCEQTSATNLVNKHVVLANDGGFFSVFNRLVSILAHELDENPHSLIVPDWRIAAMKAYYGHDQFTSFCYGTPEDGNIFLKIFKPLKFDIPVEAYNDPHFLRDQAELRVDYNERKEPDLTYTHAYNLYKRKNFQQWREMYHKYFAQHIALRDDLQKTIDDFKRKYFDGYYVIAAHVRHPSHSIEQPGGRVPTVEVFKEIIDAQLDKALKTQSKPVRIFIASDQDSVIRFFKEAYGDRFVSVEVTRTTDEQDKVYQSASDSDKKREGFQIQHIMASDKSRWTTKMAEEVIIDTWLLAASDQFVHITSNISTAVSYINPKVEMIYCE